MKHSRDTAAKTLLTATQVRQALDRMVRAMLDDAPRDGPLAIVGVRTRGEVLARRIYASLRDRRPSQQIELGVLDITFYRDDLSRHGGAPLVRATEIDFNLDDMYVLLIDDVIQTGRSTRAALDALNDFGRPKAIRLAVLVDRGGRELPIAPDFVGKVLKVPADSRVQVMLKETDGQEGIFIIKRGD